MPQDVTSALKFRNGLFQQYFIFLSLVIIGSCRNLLNEYEVYAIQKARRRSSRRRVVE